MTVLANGRSIEDVILTGGPSGGATPVKYLSTASTNANNIKATPGTVYSIVAINTTATLYFLKLYDKATAPTVGTDVPVQTFPVPASVTGAGLVLTLPVGIAFLTGIGFALTGALADNDTTSAAAGIALSFSYA
jgi:hypothetical protein